MARAVHALKIDLIETKLRALCRDRRLCAAHERTHQQTGACTEAGSA
jgi:hypothetical protein